MKRKQITWDMVRVRALAMQLVGQVRVSFGDTDILLEDVYHGRSCWALLERGDPAAAMVFLDQIESAARFYTLEEKARLLACREQDRKRGARLMFVGVAEDEAVDETGIPDMEPFLRDEQRRYYQLVYDDVVYYRIMIWLHLSRFESAHFLSDIDVRVSARYHERLHVEWLLYTSGMSSAKFVRVDRYGPDRFGKLMVLGGSGWDDVQVVQFGLRPGAPEAIDLQPIRPRAKRTGKLDNHPAVIPPARATDCPFCGHDYCSCGRCHAAGCRHAKVMCQAALDEVMRRESVPEDVAPARPLRRKRRFLFW